jgi:hypothetical protein
MVLGFSGSVETSKTVTTCLALVGATVVRKFPYGTLVASVSDVGP